MSGEMLSKARTKLVYWLCVRCGLFCESKYLLKVTRLRCFIYAVCLFFIMPIAQSIKALLDLRGERF